MLYFVENLVYISALGTAQLSQDDKTSLEMTALNLLCLARLQEMLQSPAGLQVLQSPAAASSSAPVNMKFQSQPHNRKIFKCDYEGCTKVRVILTLHLLQIMIFITVRRLNLL